VTQSNNFLFKSLNNEQLQAVKHVYGPLLVVAGAGSGKTKALTHRIANLIDKEGKIVAKDQINIYGEILKNAGNKTLLVVQKGDALWKIAYQRLGGGEKYVDIIKLNKKYYG